MKTIAYILLFIFCGKKMLAQSNIGIGTASPNASAALDVSSTSKGMLVPRMTSSQRGLISSPATGLLVFDTDTESFWFKAAANWVELVDTSNNLWKKNGTHIYTTGNTQVGIGTNAPNYDLHIKQANANIGLTDAATNKLSATITASDEDVIMNAYRSSTGGGNIILQRSSALPNLDAGNVGIGIPFPNAPAEKLQVNGNIRLQATNSKIALHDGSGNAKAEMLIGGNDFEIGTAPGNTAGRLLFSGAGNARLAMLYNGELIRMGSASAANLLPIAYGKVSGTGTVLSGTGNFTVSKSGTGLYKITLPDESNLYSNRDDYTILTSASWNFFFVPSMINASIISDNTIEIRTNVPKVYYTNSSCSQSCGPFSYISNVKFYDEADNEFSIVIYKQ